MTAEVHSRSRLAGYDPEKLARAKVTIVGLGALGQNVLQTLALSGVGNFLLIDYDRFEDHNATRSPFFPSPAEVALFGDYKAPVVAHRALAVSTARDPRIFYRCDTVQRSGDGVVRWSDLVVSAVDSISARAWLAERTRLHGKPLVEGGFFGAEFNFSAFSAEPGACCYRCINPQIISSISCTRYALEAERQHIVPAIQATAAVLGGLMAEQVINIIHGAEAGYGVRYYGNTRRASIHSALLQPDPMCPGEHDPLPVRTISPGGRRLRTVADVIAAVGQWHERGWISLAEPIVLASTCISCAAKCRVRAAESSWLINPHCAPCGGPWRVSRNSMPGLVSTLELGRSLDVETLRVRLAEVGLGPRGCVLVDPGEESPYLVEIAGRHAFMRASARAAAGDC